MKEFNQTLLLLIRIFDYLNNTFEKYGLEAVKDITDPSLEDLEDTLSKINTILPSEAGNAKQAILLAQSLISTLKSENIDELSFKAQMKSILNTNIHKIGEL